MGQGDTIEERRNTLVRTNGGLRKMPGSTLGNRHARSQRSVSAAPLVARRQSNDRRADQRVPEDEPPSRLVNLDDARSFGGGEVVEPRFTRGRGLQYPQVARTVQDGDQQHRDRRRGQVPDPGHEQVLEARRQRQDVRRLTSCRRGVSECDGQFEQRKRVALRFGDQPLAHVPASRPGTVA